MNEIIVRPAKPTDADYVFALEQKTFSSPWDAESIEFAIKDKDTCFFIAEYDDLSAGYISAKCILDEMYINNVAVNENLRKNGIATALIDRLFEFAVKNSFSFISLEVRKSNIPAIKLYEKFGFLPMGVRKNYYSLPTEDALIYTKHF